MTAASEQGGVSKAILRTAERYLVRLKRGDRIMRDATGRLQWASGKAVGPRTVRHMLDTGQLRQLDTDLFGQWDRGQSLGVGDDG